MAYTVRIFSNHSLFFIQYSSLHINSAIEAVSISSIPCGEPSNALRVYNGHLFGKSENHLKVKHIFCQHILSSIDPVFLLLFQQVKNKTIAYCVKGLSFPFTDISWDLVEWLEITKALKVDKVFLYYMQLQAKTLRALNVYVK